MFVNKVRQSQTKKGISLCYYCLFMKFSNCFQNLARLSGKAERSDCNFIDIYRRYRRIHRKEKFLRRIRRFRVYTGIYFRLSHSEPRAAIILISIIYSHKTFGEARTSPAPPAQHARQSLDHKKIDQSIVPRSSSRNGP